jgi:flavodoxin
MKIVIVYNSKTGKTRKYAEEIRDSLITELHTVELISIRDFESVYLNNTDVILLGCWTSGLMILLQRPEAAWVEFANKLKDLRNIKVGLFTTYLLATGSMFKNMKKHLNGKIGEVFIELKSRSGLLSEMDKTRLLKNLNS